MAISTEKLLKLTQFQTGLQASKNYTDKVVGEEANRAKAAESANATAAANAQSGVTALNSKIGTVPEGKTITGMISEAQSEATYDDTELRGKVTANESAIATLNGTGAGSVKKTAEDAATAAVNTFATLVSDDGAVNSFKELVDWAASHGSEASEMAAGIQTNANDIDALETGKADKATTLAGYGITNAYTKTEADAAFLSEDEVVINVATDEEVAAVCTTVFGA